MKCCGAWSSLVDRDLQAHLVVVDRHRLGHRQREHDLGDLVGAGVEADEVDRVLRERAADQRLHRHRDFLGGEEPAVAHHRAGHVEQDDRRAAGDALVQVQLEVVFVECGSSWRAVALALTGPLGRPCRAQRVVERLVQIQLADGVAVLIGLGAFDALAALAGGDLLVPLALALAEVGEDLHQRPAAASGRRPGA